MFRSRFRKVLRDVWARKGRTILVAIAIFVGVLGVVSLVSSGDIMLMQLRKDLQQDKLAMIRTFVSVPKGIELDNAAYLKTLRELPGVTSVQGNAIYPISWMLPGETEFSDGIIRSFSTPLDQIPLEPPRLFGEGRFPNPGSKEIAVEMRMALKYHLKAGDQLVLRVLGSATGGAVEETWTISGILFHPYSVYGTAGPVLNDTSIFANFEDAQYIGGFTGYNSIYVRYTDFPTAQRENERFLAAISENSPYIVFFTWTEDPADNLFIKITKQYTGIMTTLAVVAMVVCGFLVTNVISTIVLEQNRQIGVMKSLGATRWDNILMYSGIALVYGVIGLIPGVLLGVPLGYELGRYFAGAANAYVEHFMISWSGILLGVGMGLLVPVLAALIPVYNGTKVTILQAMTDLGISTKYGVGRAAKVISALPFPVNVRQALSNVVQKKGRLAMTVITLTLAVAAFMGVYGVFDSLSQAIKSIYNAFGYEIQVAPSEIQEFEQVKGWILESSQEVHTVYPGVGVSLQVEGYRDPNMGTNQVSTIGLDPTTDSFQLNLIEGTAWKDDPNREGIVLTRSVAKQLKKKVGDKLVVAVGGRSAELDIIGIDSFTFDQGFMEWRSLARLAGIGVNAPTPNRYAVSVQLDGTQVVAVGFDSQLTAFLTFESGTSFNSGQAGIILSHDLAARGGYAVGEELTLQVGERSQSYPVTGIFSLLPQMIEAGVPSEMVGMYWEDLAALEGLAQSGEPAPNTFLVQLKNRDATADQVDAVIKDISKTLASHGVGGDYTNQVADAETAAQQILSMGLVFNMTAMVMAAVGAIGLFSSLSMSVFERQKEIGVMRSIGAGSGTVAGQFLVEGILVGVISWLIGLPLSYLVGMVLMKALPFGTLRFVYPLSGAVIGLVGMIVIATVASLWPSINAARKTVSDILRYQ